MTTTVRTTLLGLCIALTILPLLAQAQQMPQTTKQQVKGTATITTEQLSGTVVQVEGNTLAVRMSTGDLREFNVPESRRFVVDGKELTVHDLKPGTKLTATVTTTTTPVTERTTTIGSGKVWYVAGTTVILTLPNGENRMYKVQDSYRFAVEGRKASVFDLKKGMVISAEKIVEEPRTEIASNTVVTGQAPPPPPLPPKTEVAQTPPPARPKVTPPPEPAAAPVPVAKPAPVVEQVEEKPPAKLPKTGSPLPLVGLLGLVLTGSSLGLRKLRRH